MTAHAEPRQPSCIECSFYRAGPNDVQRKAAETAGHAVAPGFCKRFPRPIGKSPDDFCGEHSALIAKRTLDLVRAAKAAADAWEAPYAG